MFMQEIVAKLSDSIFMMPFRISSGEPWHSANESDVKGDVLSGYRIFPRREREEKGGRVV